MDGLSKILAVLDVIRRSRRNAGHPFNVGDMVTIHSAKGAVNLRKEVEVNPCKGVWDEGPERLTAAGKDSKLVIGTKREVEKLMTKEITPEEQKKVKEKLRKANNEKVLKQYKLLDNKKEPTNNVKQIKKAMGKLLQFKKKEEEK